jgi:hypothetical protein
MSNSNYQNFIKDTLESKANQTYVDDSLALKANQTDVDVSLAEIVETTQDPITSKKIIDPDGSGVLNTSLALIDASLALKANQTYVDDSLALKANQTDVDVSLAEIVETTQDPDDTSKKIIDPDGSGVLNTSLALIDASLALKANQTDVDVSLAEIVETTQDPITSKKIIDPDGSGVLNTSLALIDASLALKANQTDVDDSLALKANQTDVDVSLAEIVETTQDPDDTSKKIIDPDGSGVLNTSLALIDASLALKANQTDVDDSLALKANQTDVDVSLAEIVETTQDPDDTSKKIIDPDGSGVLNTSLALIDASLALKANQTYVDDSLALKANQTDVDVSLAEIVETTQDPDDTSKKIIDPDGSGVLNTSLALIDASLALKANQTDVDVSLAEIVETTQDPNDTSKKIIDPDGSGVLNTSLALKANISDLDTIQTQLSEIFERLVTLEESAGSTPVVEPTEDTTAPVITLNGDSSMTIAQGSTYVDPGATATDNVDGDLTSSIVVGDLPDTSDLGEYTITYNVTDSNGNAATQVTRTVNVIEDTTAPVITLNGDSSMTIAQGSTYVDPGATATDNVDGDLSVDVSGNVDTNTVGEYTILYNVTDEAGNAATQVTRTVNVVEPTTTTLVSPNQSFTWANDGVVEVVKLQEEYTQDFKSNNVNKTLVFGASSFNVSLNDSVEIHNHDTSTMLSLGNFYDISINTTDFKLKIDRVYGDISTLANNIIVPDTGSTFASYSNTITNAYHRIYFGGSWLYNFYRILGASYDKDSISSRNFTSTNNTGSYVEVDYILQHELNESKNITLTFQLRNTGEVASVKHDAFTFDNNYYTFDDNGDFELNNMTFSQARQYITTNWNYENLQATSTNVDEYGVTVTSSGSWNLQYGILDDDSFVEFNPYLQGTILFSSLSLSLADGLKIKDGVTTIEGYILNKNDFTIYDSEETTSDVYLDFTFDQIDLSDSRKLTEVTQTQNFLPSSEFKLDSGSVTLDPTITYKIDDVDVTNQEIMIDDLTEITANEFLVEM